MDNSFIMAEVNTVLPAFEHARSSKPGWQNGYHALTECLSAILGQRLVVEVLALETDAGLIYTVDLSLTVDFESDIRDVGKIEDAPFATYVFDTYEGVFAFVSALTRKIMEH